MHWPQYTRRPISRGKLELVLQLMANILNILCETLYNCMTIKLLYNMSENNT